MHTDVAQGGCAKQGIGDGVGKNVGVGMTFESELGRNLHTTQDERPAGRDTVDIPPLS
jgi:hypothetical protein